VEENDSLDVGIKFEPFVDLNQNSREPNFSCEKEEGRRKRGRKERKDEGTDGVGVSEGSQSLWRKSVDRLRAGDRGK